MRNFTQNFSTYAGNDLLELTLLEFKDFWHKLISVYRPAEMAVILVGLLGNILALTTLIGSSKMRTPSFVYHRALVAVDLAFCINFFLNEIDDRFLTVDAGACQTQERVQYVFKYWIGAFYSGTVYAFVTNTCGFVIIYTTLIIALDRAVALLFFKNYHNWNHKKVASTMVAVTVCLSIGLHSWTCFAENSVVTYRLRVDEYPLLMEPCWNESVVYQWVKRENMSETYKKAVKAKNVYNGAVRIGYPILLSLLTISVLYGLLKRQRRRKRNRSRVANAFLSPPMGQASVSVTASVAPANSSDQRRNSRTLNRAKHGSERMLFLFMIAVVALAFIQVTASETKRLLILLFPPDVLLREKVANQALPMDERLRYFRLVLYGHQIIRLMSNFCTAVSRSFICILYMAMNKLFRREVHALLRRVFGCFANRGWTLLLRRGHELNEMENVNIIVLGRRYSNHTTSIRTSSAPFVYVSSPTD